MRSETAIGPDPGPPPPCGWVKDLCRLKCTMSKPMSPGREQAHHGVEVGAVVVQRRAHPVHDLGDLRRCSASNSAERVGVGEHQAGDVGVGLRAQIVDVDAAVLVGRELDDLEAGHRHGRGVGAVGGVRRRAPCGASRRGPRGRRASAAPRRARRGSRRRAAARRAAGRRSPTAHAAGSTSARARPARARGPAAGAAASARAARRRARAGAGCASSCTSPADRSRSPGRSCAWRCRRSGARSPARRPRAAAAAASAESAPATARATSTAGTSSCGAQERAASWRALLEDRPAPRSRCSGVSRSRALHHATVAVDRAVRPSPPPRSPMPRRSVGAPWPRRARRRAGRCQRASAAR